MVAKQKTSLLLQPEKNQTVAFVMSPRLGDSLISMVVVNNLIRNGFEVTVFGDYIHALKDWFPRVKIFSVPAVAQAREILSSYDVIMHAYHTDRIGDILQWHPWVMVLDESPTYRLRIPMPDIQVKICRELGLDDVVRVNGMKPPVGLIARKNHARVVMHPTSHQLMKNWLPGRFLQLAKILQTKGYKPEFIVGPQERKDWLWLIDAGMQLPEFTSLDAVARWIFESGWFIGNDSGVGHLASNLGVETITLGVRHSLWCRWRPTWASGIFLLPPRWLISRQLKERFWKYFISVDRVAAALDQLKKTSSP